MCVLGCALVLGMSCGEEFSGSGDTPPDTRVKDLALKDGEPSDFPGPDAPSGAMELVSGGITTLGGLALTETKLEGKPDFEVTDDGLVYLGALGAQCDSDQTVCITEGGFIP